MKLPPLASIAIVASISLTGCASSPTLDEEAQLVEYEKCLDYAITTLRDIEIPSVVARSTDEDFDIRFYDLLQRCEIFRPLPLP